MPSIITTQTFLEQTITQGNNPESFAKFTNDSTTPSSHIPPIVSHEILWYLRLFILTILGNTMAVSGLTSNVINIIVFLKMGFKDPINVSLLGLSIADFLTCLAMMWICIALTPGFTEMESSIDISGVNYVTGAWPRLMFMKISCCITAFITIERCLCVVFPLKVKELITTKRVTIALILICIFVFALTAPLFYTNRLSWKFIESLNKSIFTVVFSKDRDRVEPIAIILFGAGVQSVLYITIAAATILLVHKLKKNSKWRNKATANVSSQSSSSTNQMSSRDLKVSQMVAMIATIFIVAFLPTTIMSIPVSTVPGLQEGGVYQNLLYAIYMVTYLMETANAFANIFIYYDRSSNYKTVFDKIFMGKEDSRK